MVDEAMGDEFHQPDGSEVQHDVGPSDASDTLDFRSAIGEPAASGRAEYFGSRCVSYPPAQVLSF